MRRRKSRMKPPPRKPPLKPVVPEEIDLVDSSDEDKDVINIDLEEDNPLPSYSVKSITTSALKQSSGQPSPVENVQLSSSDPHLISMLVQRHCIFCLSPKARMVFSVHRDRLEETDGYELFRRYFGIRTADILNDVFDAAVFINKGLITAEFPAPLLCETCVNTVRELDILHRKLEWVQREILKKVKVVRGLIKENGQRESVAESRTKFQQDLLKRYGGKNETVKVVMGILDNFQKTLEEETHDHVEIHLEHIELIQSFSVEDDEHENDRSSKPISVHNKENCEVSTQTESAVTMTSYDVKIVRVSMEENVDENNGNISHAPSPKASSADEDAVGFLNDNPSSPLGLSEEEEEVPDVKSEIPKEEPVDLQENIKGAENVSADLFAEYSMILEAASVNVDKTPRNEPLANPTLPESLELSPMATGSPDTTENTSISSTATLHTLPANLPSATVHTSVIMQRNNGIISIQRIKAIPSNPASKVVAVTSSNTEEIEVEIVDEESSSEESHLDDSSEAEDSSSSESSSSDDSTSVKEGRNDSTSAKKDQSKAESKPYRCGLCRQHFRRRYDVHRHIRNIHHAEPYYSDNQPTMTMHCTECEYQCDQLYELRFHMKSVHHKSVSKVLNRRAYECDICGYTKSGIFRLTAFLDHLLKHETSKKLFICEDCQQPFSTKQMYQMHQCPLVGHPPEDVEKYLSYEANLDYFRKEYEFRCRFCAEKFYNEISLQQHFVKLHKNSQPFLCDKCNGEEGGEIAFESRNCLKTHSIEVHGAIKYKCRICKGEQQPEFNKWDDLHTHIDLKHLGGHYGCPQCDEKFSQLDQLDKHKELHGLGNNFFCNLCELPFLTELGLKQHNWKIHKNSMVANVGDRNSQTSEAGGSKENKTKPYFAKIGLPQYIRCTREGGKPKPFACKICDYKCCTSALFRRHMQLDHGIVVEQKLQRRTYQCKVCGHYNSGGRLKGFIQHLMEHETSNKNFNCDDCLARFTTRQLYQVHLCPQTAKLPGTATVNLSGNKKPTTTGIEENPTYRCRVCDLSFTSEKTVQQHCHDEHGMNAFTCEVCGDPVSFPKKADMKTHLITKHGAVPYKCRMCLPPKEFSKVLDIFRHNNMEHFGCYHECPQCKKKFINKQALKDHESTHEEEKTHICSFCGAALKSISTLRTHIKKLHTDTWKYAVCEYCGKEFSKRSNLRVHVKRVHKGIEGERQGTEHMKPMCEYCGKEFSGCRSLNAHVKRIHERMEDEEETDTGEEESNDDEDDDPPPKRMRSSRNRSEPARYSGLQCV